VKRSVIPATSTQADHVLSSVLGTRSVPASHGNIQPLSKSFGVRVSIRSTAPVRRLDPAPTVVAGAASSGSRTSMARARRGPWSGRSYAVGAAAAVARRAAAQRDGSCAGK
jgi:hypothetical protein